MPKLTDQERLDMYEEYLQLPDDLSRPGKIQILANKYNISYGYVSALTNPQTLKRRYEYNKYLKKDPEYQRKTRIRSSYQRKLKKEVITTCQ